MKDRIQWIKRLSPRRSFFLASLLAYTAGGMRVYKHRPSYLTAEDQSFTSIEQAIQRASDMYQVEVRLLEAVAMQETRMNPSARGKAGEIGLFQIMPNTAKHWSEETDNPILTEKELFTPSRNAEIAAWYLRRALDRFTHRQNPLPFALAYYNAGPSRAVKWDKNLPNDMSFTDYIPFPSTRKYVTNILRMYHADKSLRP
jgi:soluble lytic murein transglycosylase-like protein